MATLFSQPPSREDHGDRHRDSFLMQGSSRTANPPQAANHGAVTLDPLQPLRVMADRVGKEVEDFAERLDHWHTHSTQNEQAKHKATIRIIGKFRDIAESNVRELKKQNVGLDKSMIKRIHEVAPKNDSNNYQPTWSFRQTESSNESNASSRSSTAQELRDWQAELATWELVRLVFDHYHPEPGTNPEAAKKAKLEKVGGTDRFCPKGEVWERFIIDDDLAREKKVVLKWLQQTAKNSESNVDSILEQWGKESGKDINTWTSGWLETKAKIKQAKRMHATEGPLKPHVTVRGSNAAKPLITQLDPDAPMRQQRALEKEDVYYEHALWMACYEMLRRGDPLHKINEWFKERNEGWRAVSIGASGETYSEGAPNLAGRDFGYLFRRTTHLAAQSAIYPYEGAVYAIQAGNFQKIQAISRSWDDHLYAYYNALLLSRFDNYLLTEPNKRPRAQKMSHFNFPDVMQHLNNDWENATQKVVELLKQDKTTAEQARTPIKLIQGALLTRTLDDLVYKVGVAVADSTHGRSSNASLIVDPDVPWEKTRTVGADGIFSIKGNRSVVVEDYYGAFLHDPHALRILVHVFIILGNPRAPLLKEQAPRYWAEGNLIAAYVEFLRFTERLQIIPLYVAQLEQWRASLTLARVLPEITDGEAQKRYVHLMRQYGIEVEGTLERNFAAAMSRSGLYEADDQVANPISQFKILAEPCSIPDGQLWPNQQRIRSKEQMQTSPEVSPGEDAIIQSLLWYDHVDGNGRKLFEQLETTITVFLLAGRIGAAEKLVTELSVERISLSRTPAYFGYAFDFTQPGAEEQDAEQVSQEIRNGLLSSGRDSLRPSEVPSPRLHARNVQRFRDMCQSYYDLSHFVRIIVLFQQWSAEEQQLNTQRGNAATTRPGPLKDTLDAIESTFAAIIDPWFDPTDRPAIWRVYKAYIPEITLAYLAVLHAGSFLIKKELLIKAMDLAVTVADDGREQEWLGQTFKESKRMRELVDRIADVSKTMLDIGRYESKSKSSLKKRENHGQTLRIWDLNSTN